MEKATILRLSIVLVVPLLLSTCSPMFFRNAIFRSSNVRSFFPIATSSILMSSQTCTTVKDCATLFPQKPEEIAELKNAAKAKAEAALETIYNIKEDELNFKNAVYAADIAAADFVVAHSIASVVKETAVPKELRDAATEAYVEMEAFLIDKFSNNKQLYEKLKTYNDNNRAKDTLTAQQEYCFNETMEEFKRKGLDLPKEKFDESVALQKQISELSAQFDKNIGEDKSQVLATAEELKGTPDAIVSGLKKDEETGKYILKMDYPTFFGVMQNCEVASTRKAMANAFDNRAYPANNDLLHEVIAKRQELAQLLSFDSFSHFDLSSKMAKTPKAALDFIANLVPGLQGKWEIEKKKLIDQGLHESVILTEDGDFESYDMAFVMNDFKKKQLNVDEVKMSEYFPMDKTVEALFNIYESFFDIAFEKDTEDNFWHKDVMTLTVRNKSDKELIGHIVLDLFPREGKFSHACCAGVVPPIKKDGEVNWSPALAVVLANFPEGSEGKPALFKHSDVETFFHEFGHAIHYLMGRAELPTVAGYNVKMDFVELPSQMLEEWLWERDILNMVTSHYETKEKLPADLIDAKIASKNAFSGRDSLRQLQFATLALEIFDKKFASQPAKEMDSTALVLDVQPRIMKGIRYNPNTHFQCSFGHLMGYGATYYGYMWSEVYAQDAFEYLKSNNGLLDPAYGRRYINHIIGVGGGRDPNTMLREFLGREPNSDAFIKRLGM